MFWNNNQQNNRDEINVNTTITTMWSDLSSLTIGGWNDKISLRWMPAIGRDGNNVMRYDKDHRIATSLSMTKAAALYKRYEKRLKNMVENGEDPGEDGKTTGVTIIDKSGATSGIFIEYKHDENGVPSVYLTFAKNLGENGTDASNIVSYKFAKTPVLDDYNPVSGGGVESQEEGEFENFIEILKSRMTMTSLSVHGGKYSNAITQKYSNRGGRNNIGSGSAPSVDDFIGAGMSDLSDELPFE